MEEGQRLGDLERQAGHGVGVSGGVGGRGGPRTGRGRVARLGGGLDRLATIAARAGGGASGVG